MIEIWRKLFPIERRKNWQSFAMEVDGRFEQGGWFAEDKLFISYRHWELELSVEYDTDENFYTYIQTPVRNLTEAKLDIYSRRWSSRVMDMLGQDQIKLKDPMVDERFVMRSNQSEIVHQLWGHQPFRDAALDPKFNSNYLQLYLVKHLFSWRAKVVGAEQLRLRQRFKIADVATLHTFYALFKAALDQLEEFGTIAPDIQL